MHLSHDGLMVPLVDIQSPAAPQPPVIEQPQVTEADIQRVKELAEKYGWERWVERED